MTYTNQKPSRLAQKLLSTVAMSAICLSLPIGAAQAADDLDAALAGLIPMSGDEMAIERGGMSIAGVQINFGITVSTSVGGVGAVPSVVVTTNFTVTTPGNLQNLGTTIAGNVNNTLQQAGVIPSANNPGLGETISNSVAAATANAGNAAAGNGNAAANPNLASTGTTSAPDLSASVAPSLTGTTSQVAVGGNDLSSTTAGPSLVADAGIPTVSASTLGPDLNGPANTTTIAADSIAPTLDAGQSLANTLPDLSAGQVAGAAPDLGGAAATPSLGTDVASVTPDLSTTASTAPTDLAATAQGPSVETLESTQVNLFGGPTASNENVIGSYTAVVDPNTGALNVSNGLTDVIVNTTAGHSTILKNTDSSGLVIETRVTANYTIANYTDIAQSASFSKQIFGLTQQMLVMGAMNR